MCWSEDVSWAFGCLDLMFMGVLLLRKRYTTPTPNGTYAACLASIAAQEWAQYAIWKRGNLEREDNCSSAIDVVLAFTALGAAQSIPLVLIASSYLSSTCECPTDSKKEAQRLEHRTIALRLWLAQFFLVLACVCYTGKYCVEQGKFHHQVWICASAVYETGGYPLYFLSLFLYIISAYTALESMKIPEIEKRWIIGITLATGAIIYGVHFWTLEACSIWCWSAFFFGIFFCTKDLFL